MRRFRKTHREGEIHSNKIQTGPTGKSGPPQKVDQFFRDFSEISGNFGCIEPGDSAARRACEGLGST